MPLLTFVKISTEGRPLFVRFSAKPPGDFLFSAQRVFISSFLLFILVFLSIEISSSPPVHNGSVSYLRHPGLRPCSLYPLKKEADYALIAYFSCFSNRSDRRNLFELPFQYPSFHDAGNRANLTPLLRSPIPALSCRHVMGSGERVRLSQRAVPGAPLDCFHRRSAVETPAISSAVRSPVSSKMVRSFFPVVPKPFSPGVPKSFSIIMPEVPWPFVPTIVEKAEPRTSVV